MNLANQIVFRKLKLLVVFALFLFFTNSTFSQSLKTLIKQGDEAMADNDYFSAAQIYNRIILIDSSNVDYQYKYAEASRLNSDMDIAEHWYQKVFKKDNAKLYPETTYWLAVILKSKGKYKDAKKLVAKIKRAKIRQENN